MACELDWAAAKHDPEIHLRIRPLREQWEARGPGMHAFLSRRISWLELPERLLVDLAKPGAGSRADGVSASSIHFELFLVNPWPQLPEVARLAWLCARSAVFESHHDARVAAALIPPVIEAAEYVELATLDASTITVALEHWFHKSPGLTGEQLLAWWREMDPRAFQVKAAWLHAARKLDPLTP